MGNVFGINPTRTAQILTYQQGMANTARKFGHLKSEGPDNRFCGISGNTGEKQKFSLAQQFLTSFWA